MNQRTTLLTGTLLALLGVALGAFGAHALKPMLLANNRVEAYETAVRYQVYHAFALLVAGLLMGQFQNKKQIGIAALFFLIGIILFSGSLYTISFISIPGIGLLTPLGGILFLSGWAILFWGILKNGK